MKYKKHSVPMHFEALSYPIVLYIFSPFFALQFCVSCFLKPQCLSVTVTNCEHSGFTMNVPNQSFVVTTKHQLNLYNNTSSKFITSLFLRRVSISFFALLISCTRSTNVNVNCHKMTKALLKSAVYSGS